MGSLGLGTYESNDGPRGCVIVGKHLYDLADLSGRVEFASMLRVLDDWSTHEPLIRQLVGAARPERGMELAARKLLAPILFPPAVYCAGANYADHIANMERRLGLAPGPDPRAEGGRPFHFLKASRCCVGPDAIVRIPSRVLDWEGELVAVIGQKTRDVSVENALTRVAGYMIGNDLSARDLHFRRQMPATSAFHHSFTDHKSFEHSAPIGPWIVPASEIPDPGKLQIRTEVNGVIKQNGSTAGMIFSIAEQIAYLSSIRSLYPGDIIMTGTPAGTGAETGESLISGDRVTVTIDRLGSLTTYIE
jgi:2-keto-4-pentenoate hydratase/2-oxohepta-3-ene-1,7-dioic acid hydratase in catechol pathway